MSENITEEQSILSAVDQRAIELKYEGYTYAEIETLLKEQFPDTYPVKRTLEGYFYKNGRLFEAYDKYQKTQSEIAMKEARALWQNHAKNAMRAILTLMQKADKGDTKLKAAQEILGRCFGSVPKIVYQKNDSDVLDELIESMGIIEDEENQLNQSL